MLTCGRQQPACAHRVSGIFRKIPPEQSTHFIRRLPWSICTLRICIPKGSRRSRGRSPAKKHALAPLYRTPAFTVVRANLKQNYSKINLLQHLPRSSVRVKYPVCTARHAQGQTGHAKARTSRAATPVGMPQASRKQAGPRKGKNRKRRSPCKASSFSWLDALQKAPGCLRQPATFATITSPAAACRQMNSSIQPARTFLSRRSAAPRS